MGLPQTTIPAGLPSDGSGITSDLTENVVSFQDSMAALREAANDPNFRAPKRVGSFPYTDPEQKKEKRYVAPVFEPTPSGTGKVTPDIVPKKPANDNVIENLFEQNDPLYNQLKQYQDKLVAKGLPSDEIFELLQDLKVALQSVAEETKKNIEAQNNKQDQDKKIDTEEFPTLNVPPEIKVERFIPQESTSSRPKITYIKPKAEIVQPITPPQETVEPPKMELDDIRTAPIEKLKKLSPDGTPLPKPEYDQVVSVEEGALEVPTQKMPTQQTEAPSLETKKHSVENIIHIFAKRRSTTASWAGPTATSVEVANEDVFNPSIPVKTTESWRDSLDDDARILLNDLVTP